MVAAHTNPGLARHKVWKKNGDPERIRTSDLQIRNLSLYPAELRGRSGDLAHRGPNLQRGKCVRFTGLVLCQLWVARLVSAAQGNRIDDAEHLGSRVVAADAGIGQMVERHAEPGPIVEAVRQFDRRPEFQFMAKIDAISLVVIACSETGGQNPAASKENIREHAAIAVESGISGAHGTDEGLEYPDLIVGPVFRPEFCCLIIILNQIEGADSDAQKIRIVRKGRYGRCQNTAQSDPR